ncbi:13719_t:CDS:2, partial [Acaulospora colombiana]
LLHPTFAEFRQNVQELQPTEADNALARELRETMPKVWENETLQCENFVGLIVKHYGIRLFRAAIGATNRISDGHAMHPKHPYILAICEGKTWSGNGDPEVQAKAYVLEALRPKLRGHDDPLDLLPCIIIYFVVVTDRLQLEPLTDIFALHINSHYRSSQIARAFGAFRIAYNQLYKHYEDMPAVDRLSDFQKSQQATRLTFPYPDSYTVEGEKVKFTYDSRFDDKKLIFHGTTTEGIKVFIKFTTQYSLDAHQFCASVNVAPILYGFETLPGGWFMVVMEYLDPENYRTLEPDLDNKPHVENEIRQIVTALHGRGFVHGDIRGVNMMTRHRWESTSGTKNIVLLDFDWAGREGIVTYPEGVNGTSILRHGEVKDGKHIRKEHDWFMRYMRWKEVNQHSNPSLMHKVDVERTLKLDLFSSDKIVARKIYIRVNNTIWLAFQSPKRLHFYQPLTRDQPTGSRVCANFLHLNQ